MGAMPLPWRFALVGILILATFCPVKCSANHVKVPDLTDFFKAIDTDGDGEIEQEEASKFMDLMNDSEDVAASAGIEQKEEGTSLAEILAASNVGFDFSYGGSTISATELSEHLQDMLTGEKVVDWIVHGLRLPQYAKAFRENSIDGLDFPALISDNNTALKDDLGVQSPLHRHKIHTAIMRQIFGLGKPPGPPRMLECKETPCGSIQLQWDPPNSAGVPPFHKFLVQRRSMATRAAAWVQVGDPKDDALLDETNLVPSMPYVYRVQSWGGHGPSEWVSVEGCTTSKVAVQGCSIEGWDFTAAESCAVPTSMGGQATTPGSPGDEVEGPEGSSEPGKAGKKKSHFWNYMYSVNGGLLLLGILSRNSFLFRFTMTAWTLIQAKFLRKLKLKYALSQASPYFVVRLFARLVEFVAFCIVWGQAKGKLLFTKLFAASQSKRCLVEENQRGMPAKRWSDGMISTPAEFTWDEMLSAVNRTVRNKVGTVEGAASFIVGELRLSRSDPALSRSSSEASRSSIDVWPVSSSTGAASSSTNVAGREDWWKQEGVRSVDGRERGMSFEDLRALGSIGAVGASSAGSPREVQARGNGGSREDLARLRMGLQRKPRGSRTPGDRSSHSGSESEIEFEDEEEFEKSSHEVSHGADLRREASTASSGGISTQRGRFRCNTEACNVRFDRWHSVTDWRANLSKHYCRDCQGVYCVKHTRISPHGSRGQCGLDSKCLCYSCFARLPGDVQLKLERTNKLRAGPPVASLSPSPSQEELPKSDSKFKVTSHVVGWLVGHDNEPLKGTGLGRALSPEHGLRAHPSPPAQGVLSGDLREGRRSPAGGGEGRARGASAGFPENLGVASSSSGGSRGNAGDAEGPDGGELHEFTLDAEPIRRRLGEAGETWKSSSTGQIRPRSPEVSEDREGSTSVRKVGRSLSAFTAWSGSGKLLQTNKSPLLTRGVFGSASGNLRGKGEVHQDHERGRTKENEGPSLDPWGEPIKEPPTAQFSGRRMSTGALPSTVNDAEYRKMTCELRWRMCHMWALGNRGGHSQLIDGIAETEGPSSSLGGHRKGQGATVSERPMVASSGKGKDWGKGKPPRPPPTEAQKRWLKAGIWAVAKELERRDEDGEERMVARRTRSAT